MPVTRKKTKAFDNLKVATNAVGDRSLKIGIFESARYGKERNYAPVAAIAATHEFGFPAKKIPPRPFFRPTVSEKKGEWSDLFEAGAKAVFAGKETTESVLEKIGLVAAGQVRAKIEKINSPKLSQTTIDKKGSEKPLIQDGIMQASIIHKVE